MFCFSFFELVCAPARFQALFHAFGPQFGAPAVAASPTYGVKARALSACFAQPRFCYVFFKMFLHLRAFLRIFVRFFVFRQFSRVFARFTRFRAFL